MPAIFQDFRSAFRVLSKRPTFAFVIIFTLALGIGANTAIFSVVDATLLRSLPYTDPDRILTIRENVAHEATRQREASYPDFLDWQRNRSFSALAGFQRGNVILRSSDAAEMVPAGRVSADFFRVLGVEPVLGRAITTGDDEPGANPVAVLSHAAWQTRFASDPSVIGKNLTLGSATFTVVGVLPASFHFAPLAADPEIFIALNPTAEARSRRFMHFVNVIGRLKDGVSESQALSDMNVIASQIAQADPSTHANVTLKVTGLREQIVGNVRPILLVLLIAVAFVLLIACANVANLFLVRSASRQKEMSVRVALGASRVQLARQLLAESLLLSLIGGLLGLGLAYWGVTFLISAIPTAQLAQMPFLRNVAVNKTVLGYSLLISLLSGAFFAMVPILQLRKVDVHTALKEGGRSSVMAIRSRLRGALVAAEIALTLILMIGVGLMVKSTIKLLNVDPGFVTDNLLTLQVPLSGPAYAEDRQAVSFHKQLLERLRTMPGAIDAATVGRLPLNGGGDTSTPIIEGRTDAADKSAPSANVRTISANYFSTIGISLVDGRAFGDQDAMDAPRAVVVNRTFVRHFFPNENALGHRINFIWNTSGKPWTIIGVVGDENVNRLDAAVTPVIYFHYQQDPEPLINVVVRTKQDPMSVAAVARNEIRSLDPTLAVSNITSMDQIIENAPSTFVRRYPAMLIGVFAALAMILAAIGLYGVISYTVAQRTQELGVRIALGAQRGDIFKLVMRQGFVVTLLGVAIGVGGSLVLTRFLSTVLFEVSPNDPLIVAAVILLMVMVALLASFLPARRATKVDPLVALRYE